MSSLTGVVITLTTLLLGVSRQLPTATATPPTNSQLAILELDADSIRWVTPAVRQDALEAFGLAPVVERARGPVLPAVALTSAASGWCTTVSATCSVENGAHGTCTAESSHSQKCSVKGSGECSVLKGDGGQSSSCSVLQSGGYNCSVINESGGSSAPTGSCSVKSGTTAGGTGGNRCSTITGAAAGPKCSVIMGGPNKGKCSIFKDSGNKAPDNASCSTFSPQSRCSVDAETEGQCTVFDGGPTSRCSAGSYCSVMLTNGNVEEPTAGVCKGKK